ncbi:c-type cytochrome [Tropicimonas isoalkanivorans]|nr:c-type cytochrome [Tropicimonas isoalkanivorans]
MAVAGEDTAPAHAKFGLGRVALPEEIAAWNLDIMPDGTGLPEGEGDVWTGDEVFAENCAVCHGDFAEGVDNWPKLAGGKGTLDRKDPVKTVGSYWPYLSTTYDYVRRSMPFGMAQTLSDDDVYAIVAYILYSNDLVDEDFVLSKDTFLDVEMPNADGFIVDDRAETEYDQFSQEPCMESCKESVEITMRAAVLDVTPDHGGDEAAAEPAPEDDASQMAEATPEEATAESAEESASAPAAESEAAPETADASTPDAAPESADDSEPEAAAEEAAAVAVAADPELVAAGEKVFKKCQACHQVGEGAKNRVGPVLNGVVGRTAGTLDGFKYSKAMIGAGEEGLTWTSETLHEYLADPKGYLKGNKMAFAGLKKPDDVDAVVAFLEAHP